MKSAMKSGMKSAKGERGATFSDALIFLATLSLFAALLYPAWSAREFRERLAAAIADVEGVAGAARQTLAGTGRWPMLAPVGSAPPELAGIAGEDSPFSRSDYRIGWTSWSVVDSVEVIPEPSAPDDTPPEIMAPTFAPVLRSVGGVSVHSADMALLAELSERFAGETSFVVDTMWLLVLTDRGDVPPETARP
jgi:hypothetical protein